MADWLGCRSLNREGGPTEASRKAYLENLIRGNPEHAQRGYDLIVLRKKPDAGDGAMDPGETARLVMSVKDRLVASVKDMLSEHDTSINKQVRDALAAGALDTLAALEDYAKTAIDKAAAAKAPFVVKSSPRAKARSIKGVLPPEFEKMLQLASARVPILLVGPAGCGKTYLCAKLAEALSMDFSDQSCSEGMSESVFSGRLLPIGAGGAFQHVASPFMQRYEMGGVMLLDEIDAGDPNLFTYINKAVANDSYTVDQRWKKPVVAKHKDFVLVAAANTFGNGASAQYVGRNQLDAATLDRFRVGLIHMDYCRDVEGTLASPELCSWAWSVRDGIRTHKLQRIMSTRVIKDLGTMERMYDWKREDWARAYFADWDASEVRLVEGSV